MEVRGSIIIAGACIGLCAIACNKTETLSSGTTPTTTLIASSFEAGGAPSLQGWQLNASDTTIVGFTTDTPSGGGRYALRLRNAWSSGGMVSAVFPAPSGVHHYSLSTWMKVSAPGFAGYGSMSIRLKKPDATFTRKYFVFTDTTWVSRSIADTIETTLSDSIVVTLAGSFGQFSGGWTLFDLCSFEKLD